MISIAESDDEASIVLVSDKPKAVIALSDARAEALHAQLGLMIRTRKQRRGEPVRAQPSDAFGDAPDVAPSQEAPRPGPTPLIRRLPGGGEVVIGGSDATSLMGAAEARDAAEIAARRGARSSAADDARLAKREARIAERQAQLSALNMKAESEVEEEA